MLNGYRYMFFLSILGDGHVTQKLETFQFGGLTQVAVMSEERPESLTKSQISGDTLVPYKLRIIGHFAPWDIFGLEGIGTF